MVGMFTVQYNKQGFLLFLFLLLVLLPLLVVLLPLSSPYNMFLIIAHMLA